MPRNHVRADEPDSRLPRPSNAADSKLEAAGDDSFLSELRKIAGGAEQLNKVMLEFVRERGELALLRGFVAFRSSPFKPHPGTPPLYLPAWLLEIERQINAAGAPGQNVAQWKTIEDLILKGRIVPPKYRTRCSIRAKARRIARALDESPIVRRVRQRRALGTPHLFDSIDWGDTEYHDAAAADPTEALY